MKKNVGRLDAMMRITIGLTGVAWGTAQMKRWSYDSLPMLITFASAMKVAEGITRFCPLTAMFTADYNRIMEQAKDRLPVDRFTDRLEHRANQVQKTVQKEVNNTVPDLVRTGVDTVQKGANSVQRRMNRAQAGANAVQDTVKGVARNTVDYDDFEPHH